MAWMAFLLESRGAWPHYLYTFPPSQPPLSHRGKTNQTNRHDTAINGAIAHHLLRVAMKLHTSDEGALEIA